MEFLIGVFASEGFDDVVDCAYIASIGIRKFFAATFDTSGTLPRCERCNRVLPTEHDWNENDPASEKYLKTLCWKDDDCYERTIDWRQVVLDFTSNI